MMGKGRVDKKGRATRVTARVCCGRDATGAACNGGHLETARARAGTHLAVVAAVAHGNVRVCGFLALGKAGVCGVRCGSTKRRACGTGEQGNKETGNVRKAGGAGRLRAGESSTWCASQLRFDGVLVLFAYLERQTRLG